MTTAPSTTDIVSYLRKVELFAGLSEETIRILAKQCRRRKFPARTALFHQDDPGQTLYIIVSGYVNIQRETPEGVIHIAERVAGQHIGEFALLDGNPRSDDAVVGTQTCEVIMLDREPFLKAMEEYPIIAQNVIVSLVTRLRETSRRAEAQQSLDVTGRLASFLLDKARTMGEEATGGTVRLPLRMTHKEIGGSINATRETVTRCLTRLERMGAIVREDQDIVLRDTKRLRRLCKL
ncbi:MAG: Crp/Fnr family transcriptional regulator [Capsulimonadales bacterium]|nr:Crp/Fnr family transcriptional regulator [Capsulimonadales bacterium]